MYATNEALNDFVDAGDDTRGQTLTTQVQQLARLAGVVDTWGLLRSMTLNSTKQLDSDAIRSAVAARGASPARDLRQQGLYRQLR